jgi:hypothetical protein
MEEEVNYYDYTYQVDDVVYHALYGALRIIAINEKYEIALVERDFPKYTNIPKPDLPKYLIPLDSVCPFHKIPYTIRFDDILLEKFKILF